MPQIATNQTTGDSAAYTFAGGTLTWQCEGVQDGAKVSLCARHVGSTEYKYEHRMAGFSNSLNVQLEGAHEVILRIENERANTSVSSWVT